MLLSPDPSLKMGCQCPDPTERRRLTPAIGGGSQALDFLFLAVRGWGPALSLGNPVSSWMGRGAGTVELSLVSPRAGGRILRGGRWGGARAVPNGSSEVIFKLCMSAICQERSHSFHQIPEGSIPSGTEATERGRLLHCP